MIIFINSESAKFCQIKLRIKRFIHKRKVVPFFCFTVYIATLWRQAQSLCELSRQRRYSPRVQFTKYLTTI